MSTHAELVDLVQDGATVDDLVLIRLSRDAGQAADLIGDELRSERSDALLLCGTGIAATVAFVAAGLVLAATPHLDLRLGLELLVYGGLALGTFGSVVFARLQFVKARQVRRKLRNIRLTLLRHSP